MFSMVKNFGCKTCIDSIKKLGQLVYEWEQSIDDIIIYIKPPQVLLPKYRDQFLKQLKPGEQLPKLEIKIDPDRIRVGIKDTKPFIDVRDG